MKRFSPSKNILKKIKKGKVVKGEAKLSVALSLFIKSLYRIFDERTSRILLICLCVFVFTTAAFNPLVNSMFYFRDELNDGQINLKEFVISDKGSKLCPYGYIVAPGIPFYLNLRFFKTQGAYGYFKIYNYASAGVKNKITISDPFNKTKATVTLENYFDNSNKLIYFENFADSSAVDIIFESTSDKESSVALDRFEFCINRFNGIYMVFLFWGLICIANISASFIIKNAVFLLLIFTAPLYIFQIMLWRFFSFPIENFFIVYLFILPVVLAFNKFLRMKKHL
jgi:hypothetical protein